MPWFKVDDNLHSHPKARRAGLEAMGLWALAGSHCMSYLTDGVVEGWFVEAWPRGAKLAAQLVKVGLWEVHPDGWSFHDWDGFQPTREKVLAEREKTKARVERFRNGASNGVTNSVGTSSPVPVPSPDFYSPSKSQSRSNRASVSTDAIEVSEWTRKLAAQKGITSLRVIVDAIHSHTSCTVTADQAWQLCVLLLDKAKTYPTNPQPYVLKCVRDTPAEVEQTLYEQIGVAS